MHRPPPSRIMSLALVCAYNTRFSASGKVLSGGVDANALHKPKGSSRRPKYSKWWFLTGIILATALIDTGSKNGRSCHKEFKGTGKGFETPL